MIAEIVRLVGACLLKDMLDVFVKWHDKDVL